MVSRKKIEVRETGDPGQLSFPGSLLQGFVTGGSMYS